VARLPTIRRLLRENIPEAPDWIDKLLNPLNKFFEETFAALDKNITFEENIRAQLKSITFTTGAAYDGTAANFEMLVFSSTLPTKVQGVIIMQIKADTDNYTPIEGDVCLDWQEINKEVQVGLIRGLSTSTKYILNVLVI